MAVGGLRILFGEVGRVDTSSGLVPAASRALPSGTVTFAFTDIEGSAQRWERDRAAMQAALRRHDDLMRAAIVEHGGHVLQDGRRRILCGVR